MKELPDILVHPPPPCPQGLDPHGWQLQIASRILHAAVDHFRPVAVFACCSGGHDSVTAVELVMRRIEDARVLHINTGIGIEATRQYVRDLCDGYRWPLVEQRTPVAYEDIVLGRTPGYKGGFPGPAMHNFMYQRLKERAIRLVTRKAKEGHHRHATVMFVSGIYRGESQKRANYNRCVSKVDSQIWVNPWYWDTGEAMRGYRDWCRIPNNPVREKLGMSGECLCGAYAEPGELDRVENACPATAAHIRGLEKKVRDAGFPWGWEDPGPPEFRRGKGRTPDHVRESMPTADVYVPDDNDFRPMCHNCDKVHMVKVAERKEIAPPPPMTWNLQDFLKRLRA